MEEDILNRSGSQDSNSSGNRWDPNVLNDFECKNVFVDDAEEHLPKLFDHDQIVKQKKDECQMCQEQFNMLKRTRHNCAHCGISVCGLCSQA